MANPYHNETGQFCSRDKMLNSIHQLAASGKITEYLALKKDFDEIDKGNIVVSKEFLSSLLEKAGVTDEVPSEQNTTKEEPASIDYNDFDSSVLSDMISNLGYKVADGEPKHRETILKILEDTGYEDDILYAAIESKGLTYEQKAKLVQEHDVLLYSVLVKKEPEEVFLKDKDNFLQAVKEIAGRKNNDSTAVYQLSQMVEELAERATSKEELQLAVETVPYGHYTSNATSRIMENRLVDKNMVNTVLDNEVFASQSNYWSVRNNLVRNLSSRGFLMPRHPEFNHKPTPVAGSASAEDLTNAQEKRQAADRTINKLNSSVMRERADEAQAKVDSYSHNFKVLQKLSKQFKHRYETTPNSQDVNRRIQLAVTYLNKIQDYAEFRRHINLLKF